MTWDAGVVVVGLTSIAAFVVAFHFSGLVFRVRGAVTLATQAMAVIAKNTLDDDTRELLVQRAAIRMFAQFVQITLSSILVLAVPGAIIWMGEQIGLAPLAAVSEFLLSWEVIIGATVLGLATAWHVRHR